jgi:hypothetical protein
MATSARLASVLPGSERAEAHEQLRERQYAALRTGFWIYVVLVFGEGILRKWVFPSMAGPLIIIRDPIALWLVIQGLRTGAIAKSAGFYYWLGLGLICTILGMASLPWHDWPVVAYGFKCDFLHLPIIFLIPNIFSPQQLRKLMSFLLYLSLPMALLMYMQFKAAPDAFINSGLDSNFTQIGSVEGHIRPPGVFSFAVGPTLFYPLIAAIVIGAMVDRIYFPKWLIYSAILGCIVATVCSSSRGQLAGLGSVIGIAVVVGIFLYPKVTIRLVAILGVIGIVAAYLAQSPILSDATGVFASRIEQAGTQGENEARVLNSYTSIIHAAEEAPLSGVGMGVGTNVGSQLLVGFRAFLLAEEEWPRIVLELGPIFGILYLLYRIGIAMQLFGEALLAARRRFMLPACVFGASVFELVQGGFGQPTVLGMTILCAGLCAAVCDWSPAARLSVTEGYNNEPVGEAA